MATTLSAMRNKKKVTAILLILMILMYILFARVPSPYALLDDDDGDSGAPRPYEVAYEKLKLDKSTRHVPVVIVDQHQEVIPYWYKAVKNGLIQPKGNTVIHIDAHSDMAPPSNLEEVKKFQSKKVKLERHFLPMMQSNDAFLYSAILEGLVNRVIWIKPDWLKDNDTRQSRGYVGVTEMTGYKAGVMCYCDKNVVSGRTFGPYSCFREDPAREAERTEITFNQCKGLRSYSYIEISEANFMADVQFKKSLSVFVDIDEDFFGVESGVENFLLHGIPIKTQKILDSILPRLYALENVEEETALDKKMSETFTRLAEILMFKTSTSSSDTSLRQKVRDAITLHTAGFFRSSQDVLPEFVIFLSTLSSVEADSLSKVRYCLLQSHRLVLDKKNTEFSICHGNIYPGDRFVQDFFVGSSTQIEERANNLQNILQHIHKYTQPKFYTVARSLRDGYVPRDQQNLIERNIMKSIDRCERGFGRFRRTFYDPFLSFGKMGWTPVENKNLA